MAGPRVLKIIFPVVLLCLSVGFFILHVKGVIEKSLEKKTTIATSQVHFHHLSPPAITLCPKQLINIVKLNKKYGRTFNIFQRNPFLNNSEHHSRVRSKPHWDLYMDISYVLGKDLELLVNTYNKHNIETNINLKIGINRIHDHYLGNFTIFLEEVITGYTNGLCYKIKPTLSLTDSMTSIFGIFIKLRVPYEEYPETFVAFMEDDFEYNALNYKPWPGSRPFTADIRVQKSNVVSTERKIWNFYERNQQRPCVYYKPNESYIKCFANNHVSKLLAMGSAECGQSFCTSPKTQTFLRLAENRSWKNVPPCQSFTEELCWDKHWVSSFVYAEGQCQKPCNVTEYRGYVRRLALPMKENLTYVGIINSSNTVTFNQEVLIYDILNFIGSVGGSLGLFIGFSFFDCGQAIFRFLCQKLFAAEQQQHLREGSPFEMGQ